MKRLPPLCTEVLVDLRSDAEPHCAIGVVYELGKWQGDKLARELIHWLPDFALTYEEQGQVDATSCVKLLAEAALSLYKSKKPAYRGDVGELLLHALLRTYFDTLTVVSKYYYKNNSNDTPTGFDCAHVIEREDGSIELWLGEAKFFKTVRKALEKVAEDLKVHVERDYLKSEFLFIRRKMSDAAPHSEKLKALFVSASRTLDQVIERLCIPVFITYESRLLRRYTANNEGLLTFVTKELKKHHATFRAILPMTDIRFVLLLMPLESKEAIISSFDSALKGMQELGQ